MSASSPEDSVKNAAIEKKECEVAQFWLSVDVFLQEKQTATVEGLTEQVTD